MLDISKVPIIEYINQLPGLSTIKSSSSEIIACSPRWLKLLGFKKIDQVIGLKDQELPCGASQGAKNFQYQDMQAIKNGEHYAIDIYRYADNELKFIYSQKHRLIHNDEVIGSSFLGTDLLHSSNLFQHFSNLVACDSRYLQLDKQHTSYEFQLSYPDFDLTPRESFCLFYLLRGKSNHEISQILHRSIRTIEGRITSIRHKMGCHTRQQLIEQSIARGYNNIILKQLLRAKNISIDLS